MKLVIACRILLFVLLGYTATAFTNSYWHAAGICVLGIGIGVVAYFEGRLAESLP